MFSIYNLSFIDFLNILGVYKIIDIEKIENAVETMEDIGEDGLLLETYNYSEEYNKWTKSYLDKNMKWYVPDRYTSYTDYEDIVKQFLESDLYEIVEFEIEDELYCIEKEAYIKKMEFYNQNKESYEDLKEPKQFKELFAKKVILTQKGIKFLNEINKSFK